MGSQSLRHSSSGLWLLSVVLFSFLIPREFQFSIGAFQLNPSRVLLIAFLPVIVWQIFSSKSFKWFAVDSLALMTFLWPIIAYWVVDGFMVALESGGVLFVETALPYFLARMSISRIGDLVVLSKRLLFCIVLLVVVSIPETFTGQLFIHDISGLLTGKSYYYGVSTRLGLWRAMGPMDHPIVLGTICSSGILIAYALATVWKKYWLALFCCLVGTFISLSSAPLLIAVLQVLLIMWLRLTRGFANRWLLLFLLIVFAYVFIDLYSNRDPFRVMFSYLLFNPSTGYARYYMWLNGLFLVNYDFVSVVFGYGNSTDYFSLLENPYWEYVMKRTIDSFWLNQLLHFGWSVILIHSLFLVVLFRKLWKKYLVTKKRREKVFIQSWMIVGLALTLIGFTVDFWSVSVSFYYIVIGAAIGIKTTKTL